ncbi:histidine kinase [Streptomyces sp. NPDC005438]|uniref:sensor histidine kinase n=1 Tax=Streptomyces sp. NPDC005438 TaxID=3156880 RepID=UPI00339FBB3B
MAILVTPLRRPHTYKALLYAHLGLLALVLAFPVAAISAAWAPPVWRLPVSAVSTAACFALLALPGGARRASVRWANRLLDTALPEPLPVSAARWPNYPRTLLWWFTHAVLALVMIGPLWLLLLSAAVLVAVWGGGGGTADFFGYQATVDAGLPGIWTLPTALCCVLLAGWWAAVGRASLRRLAPLFLEHHTAERLAATEARVRQLAEQGRLARELHDSIGHTLTSSTIQAAVARELMESHPQRARQALDGIERSSRIALEDLDHVLGALRAHNPQASTEPTRTLDDLPALLAGATGAGVRVDATLLSGQNADPLPASLSREAYRVAQEGLTNAMRYGAEGQPVRLRTEIVEERLEVEVVNEVAPGTRRKRNGGGHGMTGLRERVELLGGRTEVGPQPPARWRLLVTLPLRSTS